MPPPHCKAHITRRAPRCWEATLKIEGIPVRIVQYTTWEQAMAWSAQRMGIAPIRVGWR